MNKHDYDNMLRRQCMSLPALCAPQLAGVREGLAALPGEMLTRVRNVTLTGCGDSFFAARAAVPAFKKYNSAFAATLKYERCIDAARFMELPAKYGETTVIVGISASGGAARLKETMLRANKHGFESLLITNRPQSPAASAAKHVLCVGTPEFPQADPGLRSYYASLTGAYLLAASLGAAKGICPAGSVEGLERAITDYTAAVGQQLDAMDSAMFALAQRWRAAEAFEAVGDDICHATAQFICAKFTETAGILCPVNDTEDWCHVNYFGANAERRPLIAVADITANNRSRVGETINQAAGVGRPVLLIANAPAVAFGVRFPVEEWVMPTPPEGYGFLLALLGYLPGALLASYVAALTEEPYFRGERFAGEGVMTVKSSEIAIV